MPNKPNKMNPTIAELEQGLKIDRNALEIEWEKQPDLFYRVSKALEGAISLRDEAETHVKEIEAKTDQEIRKKYTRSEEKVTEAQIKALLLTNPGVQEAKEDYLRLKEECGLLGALKDAYKQRSYALTGLVELYLGNYYSDLKKTGGEFNSKQVSKRQAREAMAEGRRRPQ